MYIRKAFFLNCGPTKNLEIEFPFNIDGAPKPVLLVGKNGSGKTNVLSFITDALIEIAAEKFQDVSPINEYSDRQYYRVLGSNTISIGAEFELSILEFYEEKNNITYLSKAGIVDQLILQEKLNAFAENISWNTDKFIKKIFYKLDNIEKIYRQGCYVSFPVNRSEIPFWSYNNINDERSKFYNAYKNRLDKAILVESNLDNLKPWLMDVILDYLHQFYSNQKNNIQIENEQNQYENFNTLIKKILLDDKYSLLIKFRHSANSKLFIGDNNYNVLLPSLNAMSSGQSTLLSIFSTILRYADNAENQYDMKEMKGIVLVDEIDAHLHAELSYTVLPKLIKLFPKIQFIMTAHNPLLALGMEKEFGQEGYALLEMPEGNIITSERFKEFEKAYSYLKETKIFDEDIKKSIKGKNKPLILCEGVTDVNYYKTAIEVLDYEEAFKNVEIDYVGNKKNGGVKFSGKDNLKKFYDLLLINSSIVHHPIIFVFDHDEGTNSDIKDCDSEFLYIRKLTQIANKKANGGIENLLPESVFLDEYYNTKCNQSGATQTVVKELDKTKLCTDLCKNKDPVIFKNFEPILKEFMKILKVKS